MESSNTEQNILQAAEREFLDKGFAGAKTTSIAAAAGVTHTMLHYYFRTKENLFNKVYEQKVALLAHSVSGFMLDSKLSLRLRIQRGIEAHFDFLSANPDLPRFVINEIISNPQRLQNFRETIAMATGAFLQHFQEDLDEAADRGEIRRICALNLLLDAVSLNVFLFIMFPIAEAVTLPVYGTREALLAARRTENVQVILYRLLPNLP
ncbi:MAG: TetR/AcrR family transcriptional regulator [Alistipes sp.]|nr:TetR/AcrR family transcriptional regulator [Alistipes sp.]